MRRVMVTVHLDSFLSGLIGVGRALRASARYAPVFCFAQRYHLLDRDLEKCRREAFEVLTPFVYSSVSAVSRQDPPAGRANGAPLLRLLAGGVKAAQRLASDLPPCQCIRLASRLARIRAMFRREHIAAVVLGGDIVHYDTALYIRAAHLERMPAIVAAGWMINQDENAEAFMWDPRIDARRALNRFVGRLYPQWLYEYKGRRLLRLPAAHVLARQWLGLAPPSPWTLHSGHADAITVESRAMLDACLREGLPAHQLVFTGSAVQDVMAAALADAPRRREQLYAELELPHGRPLILCALPPDEFYREGGRPECDFRNHRELVEFWIATLTSIPGWNVVLSLHPSLRAEDWRHLEHRSVRISGRHTAELVPLCDVFVASVSTTIQWATACRKPVINYDAYRYRQEDYRSIGGMMLVEERDAFASALARLTGDRSFYEDMVERQRACAEHWGRLDGKAGERIVALIDRLIAGCRN